MQLQQPSHSSAKDQMPDLSLFGMERSVNALSMLHCAVVKDAASSHIAGMHQTHALHREYALDRHTTRKV